MAQSTRKNGEGPSTPGLFDAPREPRLWSVSQLTGEIKARVGALGRVRVEGELSGLKRPASGHLYFELKDRNARLSCAIWRSQTKRALAFRPEEGAQVLAHGRLDVYAPRGTYTLVVDRLEPLGIGALLAQLEKLKEELAKLGWFERSRPLPPRPAMIGVVTSRDGAALRDFLRTRSLRWPGYPVRLCHSPVQGPGAADEIADAIDRLDASGVDVLVVCRGGGSLEDLWAFNERPVAEAIRRASVPVVSGVGHESDTTLADLVADHRAHTPTDAAQLVIPDRALLDDELARWGNFLIDAIDRQVTRRADRLEELASRPVLRDAEWILGERFGALDALHARLAGGVRDSGRRGEVALERLFTRLERQSPQARLGRHESRVRAAGERLRAAGARTLESADRQVSFAARGLEAVSPLAVLGRGYSLTHRRGETKPLVRANEVAIDDELETRLGRGAVRSRVIAVEEEIS